jgi:hypothetical protein
MSFRFLSNNSFCPFLFLYFFFEKIKEKEEGWESCDNKVGGRRLKKVGGPSGGRRPPAPTFY